MRVKIVKVGSIYELSNINGLTNMFNRKGRFILRNAIFRVLGVSTDSQVEIKINGVSNKYLIQDIQAMFQGDSSYPYFPYMLYYNEGATIEDNEFVFGIYTEDIVDSVEVNLIPATSSNPKFGYEAAIFDLGSSSEPIRRVGVEYVPLGRNRKIM